VRKIFRDGKVFNTDVDKFVENRAAGKANLRFFNAVMRFAQELCNKIFALKNFLVLERMREGEVLCFV